MYRLPSLLVVTVLAVACVSAPTTTPFPSTSASPQLARVCAPKIPAGGAASLTTSLLPHVIGSFTVFGLDGRFLATASGYPLGASRAWHYLDAAGESGAQFAWPISSQVLQSPDGLHLVYFGSDTASGVGGVVVRDTRAGPARPLAAGERNAFQWADANHVLLDSVDDPWVIHSVDIRDGSDRVVFVPPPPPVTNPSGSNGDWWDLSGDLRWAVLRQVQIAPGTSSDGAVIASWLYDREKGVYVGSLDPRRLYLAPVGDLAIWWEGNSLNAMHLCDRRVVTLGTVSADAVGGPTWSSDGRYLSLYSGSTDEDHGPNALWVVDTVLGRVAQIRQPWGYISKWSPDDQYVVLARRGYLDTLTRLATLTMSVR